MNKNKIINRCDKFSRFSFYCLVYFLPISIALVEIFSSFALVSFLVKRGFVFVSNLKKRKRRSFASDTKVFLRSYKPVKTSLNLPIGMFLFANVLSVLFSQDYGLSLKGFFFKLLQGLFIYFTFVECMKKKGHIRFFIAVYLVSATLIGINGLAQVWTGKGFVHGHVVEAGGRIISSLKHPNDLGTYLVTILPIVISLAVCLFYAWQKNKNSYTDVLNIKKYLHPRFFHLLMISLAIVLMICLGFTFSRGAWLGFFLALVFFGLKDKKILPIFLLMIVIFCIIFNPKMQEMRNVSLISDNVVAQNDEFREAVERMKLAESQQPDPGMIPPIDYIREWMKINNMRFRGMGRKYYWREAVAIIHDYPLFGAGLNTYSEIGQKYKIGWGGYPHNCYLQMGAEIGIIGLIAFIWMINCFYKDFYKNLASIKNPCLRYLVIGPAAGLTAFLVHSFLDTNLYSVQLANLFWLVLALGVVIQTVALNDKA